MLGTEPPPPVEHRIFLTLQIVLSLLLPAGKKFSAFKGLLRLHWAHLDHLMVLYNVSQVHYLIRFTGSTPYSKAWGLYKGKGHWGSFLEFSLVGPLREKHFSKRNTFLQEKYSSQRRHFLPNSRTIIVCSCPTLQRGFEVPK